jgi:gamma-glutamyltranspeptidase/glutathione hydrolase
VLRNIGGGGIATLHLADVRDVFLNFSEKAPGASTEKMFLDAQGEVVKDLSLKGYLAVAVPGTVMGLDTLLQKYGTLPRDKVMAPAIRLAEDGFVLTQGDADILAASAKVLAEQPNVASIFLKDGKPFAAGDRLIQKNLAATLKAISASGPDAFYKGPIADRICRASAANGGILSKQDLASYGVTEDKPVRCNYRATN